MQDHIVRLELDTSHWTPGGVLPGRRARRRPDPLDDAEVRRLSANARSVGQVIEGLGLDPSNGSTYRRVQRRLRELGVPTDHFLGQAWARDRGGTRRRRPLAEILVRDSPWRGGSSSLRDRLVEEGVLSWACAICGLRTWNDQRAPLQLDHVNGDPRDNRRENLRLLCPNCHAQTATYCGRNIGNRYSSGSSGG